MRLFKSRCYVYQRKILYTSIKPLKDFFCHMHTSISQRVRGLYNLLQLYDAILWPRVMQCQLCNVSAIAPLHHTSQEKTVSQAHSDDSQINWAIFTASRKEKMFSVSMIHALSIHWQRWQVVVGTVTPYQETLNNLLLLNTIRHTEFKLSTALSMQRVSTEQMRRVTAFRFQLIQLDWGLI